MVCRSSAFSPNTCQSKCFPLRSSSRPIHSGGNERRSLEFINDSRIRLLSSFHSINTIITIRVTGVTTMTHGPRRADRERSLPIITGRSICQFTYEFTTSRLDHRLIEILREEANLAKRVYFSLVETDLNV